MPQNNKRKCKQCNEPIPRLVTIEGKEHRLDTRRYCLSCRPFQKRERSRLSQLTETVNGTEVKRCTECGEVRPITDYYKQVKNGLENWYYPSCKRCFQNRINKRNNEIKAKLVAMSGGECQLCGYSRCQTALHFHHIDPTTKTINLALTYRKWDTAVAEVKKCILVCSNCHSEIEAGLIPQESLVRPVGVEPTLEGITPSSG